MPPPRAQSLLAGWLAFYLLGATALPSPARAEPPEIMDVETRLAARKLGAEGLALFAQEEWAAALDRFDRAHALVPAPTLAIRSARCLVELGRLVEASERYQQVIQMELSSNAPYVHQRAKHEARLELDALLPRIPLLVIRVNRPVDGVSIDEHSVPLALLGERRPTDPGEHTVAVTAGTERIERLVSLDERETKEVSFEIEEPRVVAPPPVEAAPEDPMNAWQLTRWVAVGVAGTGIVTGVSHSFVALAQQGSLDERCPDGACPPEAWAEADFYDTVRVASTIGFIGAAVGVAAGVTSFFLAPAEPATKTGSAAGVVIVPIVGAGEVGIAGRF